MTSPPLSFFAPSPLSPFHSPLPLPAPYPPPPPLRLPPSFSSLFTIHSSPPLPLSPSSSPFLPSLPLPLSDVWLLREAHRDLPWWHTQWNVDQLWLLRTHQQIHQLCECNINVSGKIHVYGSPSRNRTLFTTFQALPLRVRLIHAMWVHGYLIHLHSTYGPNPLQKFSTLVMLVII